MTTYPFDWVSTRQALPSGEALVVTSDGRFWLAVLVRDGSDDDGVFMEARSCDLLPWPTHWMPLPPLPWAQIATTGGECACAAAQRTVWVEAV